MKLIKSYLIFVALFYSIENFHCTSSMKNYENETSTSMLSFSYIKSNYLLKYPENQYILGIGIVESSGHQVRDQRLADYYAFSEIANQIIVNIQSNVTIQNIEILNDINSEFQEITAANIVVTSSVMISGLKIVDRLYDTKNKIYYSVAVLDRKIALAHLKEKLNNLKLQYESNLISYKNLYNKGRILQALNDLKSAYHSAMTFNELFQFYQIFHPIFNSHNDEFILLSTGEIFSMVYDLLSKLTLIKIKGDNQEGMIGKPLPLPLEMKVILKDTLDLPVVGIPVHFTFSRGKGKILQKAVTNDEGIASTFIEALERSANEFYTIEALLDFSSLLDTTNSLPRWNDLFNSYQKSENFTIRLKKLSNLKVLLITDGEDKNYPITIQTLARELKKAGLNPITENDIDKIYSSRVKQLINQNDLKNLHHEFTSDFSLIIFCSYNIAYTSEYSGIYIANVVGSVKAISIDKSELIAEESFTELKGFGNNYEQAKINALKSAGVKIAESIISQILK